MGSNGARAAVLVAALAAVVVLFVVLSGADDEEPQATTAATTTEPEPTEGGQEEKEKPENPGVATIVVKNGQPVGGVQDLEFTKGEDIVFRVRTDVADHVHFHGYDVFMDVAAGGEVRFDVPADVEGVFEVELEDRAVPIAEITVSPS